MRGVTMQQPATGMTGPGFRARCGRVAAAGMLFALAACGGGGGAAEAPGSEDGPTIRRFSADRADYYVGDRADLTAEYVNGQGRIEPGNLPIASGATLRTEALQPGAHYRLVVSDGARSVSRELSIEVRYRDRLRSVAMPFARAEHVAVPFADGRVLIVGGDAGQSALPDRCYWFDPQTERFTSAGLLSSGRLGFTAALLHDGRVLISGGLRAVTSAPEAELFDPRNGASVATTNPPPGSRYGATASVLGDGRVLIAGGLSGNGAERSADLFDPATARFTRLPATMTQGRYAHTANVLDDGRVLLYGGFTGDGRPAAPELFDPQTGQFAALPAAEDVVRGNHVAVRTADGAVWIAGGEDMDITQNAAILRFDPQTLSFAPRGALALTRILFAAAPLVDGGWWLAGGDSSAPDVGVTNRSERIGADGVRRDGPALGTRRFMHTVTPLPNGKLLIVGGADAGQRPLASAEIYE